MSIWTGKSVKRWKPKRIESHPDWWAVDCGCCAGLEWGGESPRECRSCQGSGLLNVHRPSGTMALWPGGPLNGKAWPSLLREIDQALEVQP